MSGETMKGDGLDRYHYTLAINRQPLIDVDCVYQFRKCCSLNNYILFVLKLIKGFYTFFLEGSFLCQIVKL